MEEKNNDLNIAGFGRTNGGEYRSVKISGCGNVSGELTCEELSTAGSAGFEKDVFAKHSSFSGSAKFRENLETDSLEISGAVAIDGALQSKNINISGTLKVKGKILCDNCEISGSLMAGENIKFKKINASGSFKTPNNCEGDVLESRGSFEIGELLSADTIILHLNGMARAKEIGGQIIKVYKGKGLMKDISSVLGIFQGIFNKVQELRVEVIEGDDIYLENTICNIVRGNKVVIGEGCKIEKVEYKEYFESNKNSQVKENVRI